MQGGDLRHALSARDGDEWAWNAAGAAVALDVARGLHFLHSSNVVHRHDVLNVILGRNLLEIRFARMPSPLLERGSTTAGMISLHRWSQQLIIKPRAEFAILFNTIPHRGCLLLTPSRLPLAAGT